MEIPTSAQQPGQVWIRANQGPAALGLSRRLPQYRPQVVVPSDGHVRMVVAAPTGGGKTHPLTRLSPPVPTGGAHPEQWSEPVDGPRPGDVKGRTFPRMI